jgi:hypothetical protein
MPQQRSRGALVAGWLGMLGHLAMLFWYAGTGLVAPRWAVGVLLGVWLLLLVAGVVGLRRRPAPVLLLPVLDIVIWMAAVTAGEAFLDWTA